MFQASNNKNVKVWKKFCETGSESIARAATDGRRITGDRRWKNVDFMSTAGTV